MLLAEIKISKTNAKVTELAPVTAGLVGATVAVEFDSTWKDYSKVYVWSGNNHVIADTMATGIVPAEVVEKPKSELKFGVYGIKDGKATPTVWANLGFVRPGADPSGEEAADPSLPIWAQLKEQIDNMQGADPDEIRQIISEYLAEHSAPAAAIGWIDLLHDRWVGSNNLYSQVVTLAGVTPHSQVDITPSVEELVIFYEKDLTFVTENDGGTVTVYAIGQRPLNDYRLQVTITEVSL